jgi:hypothetical protein
MQFVPSRNDFNEIFLFQIVLKLLLPVLMLTSEPIFRTEAYVTECFIGVLRDDSEETELTYFRQKLWEVS